MNYIDSHSHLQNFGDKVEQVLNTADENGCSIHAINASSLKDWSKVLSLSNASKYRIIPFIGLHPWYVDESISIQSFINHLESILKVRHCGVGEIGLDKIKGVDSIAMQELFFNSQLELASKYCKPVSIHSVKSHSDIIRVIKSLNNVPVFMVHSFTGSLQMARDILNLGGFISLSFATLRAGESRLSKLLEYIPSGSLLLETDSPDQKLPATKLLSGFDVDWGGKNRVSNSPADIHYLYEIISNIKGIDQNSLVDNITMNFDKFIEEI